MDSMDSSIAIAEINNKFREISEAIFADLRPIMAGKEWDHAFLDVRRTPDSDTTISKIRVVAPDGVASSLLDTELEALSAPLTTLVWEIYDLKKGVYPRE